MLTPRPVDRTDRWRRNLRVHDKEKWMEVNLETEEDDVENDDIYSTDGNSEDDDDDTFGPVDGGGAGRW